MRLRAASRASYAAKMARADCPKCGGTGWKIVEGDLELPPTLARGAGQNRSGGAAAARVAAACECVVQERASRSLERTRIPSRYEHCTFESFETDYFEGPQAAAFNGSLAQAKLMVEGFARDYPLTNDAGLLVIGPCGAGKTHLAIAATKELVARGHDALFYDYRELLKEIQSSYNPESAASEMSVLDPVLRVEVLLLDDLGASKPSAWALEMIGHILTTRYNEKRVTLLTSNYLDGAEATEPAPRQRAGRLPSGENFTAAREDTLAERVGTRIRSRLYEMCRTVEIYAPDFRKEVRKATGYGS
jgi:DNA replication protein DnaC